eukprot:CAMPEP_0171819442 /NCGR_PEP_ID=MMETSP0992-20121227/2207_1 /TAXON_ID=483369 /ORGANISM="non described non described, Strain CCMP2098" /LENGTH=213 /DNA_ID=CAMNT_0012433709 /DNA_START=108 /DNA_END=747 /DNA_ORIENTATION=-
MGIFCFESVCQAEILEFSDHHAVVSDACISHLDGTVLIWPQENIDPSIGPSGYFRRSTITSIKVRYHPFRDGVPGHEEYNPEHARRSVLLRAAPFGDRGPPAPGSRPNVVWREQGVDGAAILGTFTMGAGTTRSRPGFDQYSSTWHGFLEPLLDVWAHVRRIHRLGPTRAAPTKSAPGMSVPDRRGARAQERLDRQGLPQRVLAGARVFARGR